MINFYAAVAQEERRMISERTKAGLAVAKARGVKLGGPRLPSINKTRQADAARRAQAIGPVLFELARLSARAAAAELNARKLATPSGAPLSAKTVIRARERLAD
jgi:DNA invertase Pin-like site-specific DNA recombinase